MKERKVDDATLEELKDTFLLNDSVTEEDEEEGDSKPNEKKFYQIETKITFTDGENEDERVQTFVVNTFNVDRAMMLITHYLKNKEEECEKQAKEKGHEFRKKSIQPLNLLNLSRSGGLFRKSFQWLIWNNFVNLPVRSVKMGRAKMGGRSGVLLTFERCTW